MTKFFKIVMLFVFPMFTTFGQTHQDSANTYNKLNKWAVVKLTIAYMTDDENKRYAQQKSYENLSGRYKTYKDSVNLVAFERDLSKDWSSTTIEVYNNYKEELVTSKTKFKFKEVSFVPSGNVNSRNDALLQISKTYDSLLALSPAPAALTKKPVDSKVPNVKPDNGTSLFTILLYLVSAISIFLNIGLLYLIYKLISKKRSLPDVKQFNDSYQREKEGLIKRINELEDKNVELNKIIRNYHEKPISQLNQNEGVLNVERPMQDEKLPMDEVIISDVKPIEDEKSETIVLNIAQVNNPIKTIYLPSPFQDRRFAAEDASENEKLSSLYIAKIDSRTNKGSIRLIETANLSIAINSPNLYLETVCDYDNQYNAVAKGIKVTNPGEVFLEGEDWVVKKKIRIKFI